MKILYIHQYFSTPEGATGTRSYSFAKAMQARGHSVTVLCGTSSQSSSGLVGNFARGRREGSIDGIRVIQFSGNYSNRLGPWSRVKEFVSFAVRASLEVTFGARHDVVLASSTPLTVVLPALAGLKFRSMPFVFEVRDSWPDILIEMGVMRNPIVIFFARLLETVAYRSASAVVALAPSIQEKAVLVRGNREGVFMVPNGSDLLLFTPKLGARQLEKGSESLDLKVVYAGTHGHANGLGFLLSTAELLNHRGVQNVCFVFIGDGSKKESLVATAAELQLSNVEFLPSIPKSDLAKLLPMMSIGLQILEKVEGFRDGTSPNKFFDYLASGLPVITNYPGWVAEVISNHRCGWVVDSPDELANLLQGLAIDTSVLREYGSRSRSVAENLFDRREQANRVCEVVESVCSG